VVLRRILTQKGATGHHSTKFRSAKKGEKRNRYDSRTLANGGLESAGGDKPCQKKTS